MTSDDSPGAKPATLAAQALGWVEPTMRSLVPPVYPGVSYERDADGSYPGGHTYTREHNPTYDQVEALLAKLEGGRDAVLFASGMAAATTVFETVERGAHVLAPRHMYWTIRGWMEDLSTSGRIALELYENADLDDLAAKLRAGETACVWLETPSNPTSEVTDIAAACELAHRAGALVVADSTTSTPVLCRPLEHGVDIVMHSATKQLNGHSDVLAGALVTAKEDETWQRIRHERAYRGAVLGPFESWLLLRGMRTLYLRVPASCAGALQVAEALHEHAEVLEVMYAGLPHRPGHAIAKRQMNGGFGSLLSFRVQGGGDAAMKVAADLKLFKNATSLGGIESLVEHRAIVEGPRSNLPADLLRLSIGIEDPDDLVADLGQALGRISE